MQTRNLHLVTTALLAVFALFTISCSSPGSRIISKFDQTIGSKAVKKEFQKGDNRYTWNNVNVEKDAELKTIVDNYMKVEPTETQPLAPFYDSTGKIVSGKFLKYWVYETAKLGVELNYYITGKTMTVEVRVTEKIGAQ